MSFLLERDALNGKAGRAFAVIDGRNVEMFGLKKIQADAEFQESDFKVVGTNLVQKKTSGVSLTGSATVYYGTPEFLNMLKTYLMTGALPYFTIQITNEDEGSSIGSQTVALYNVKLQKLPIAMLDADTEFLTMDIAFSFTNVEVLNAFSTPVQLGE
ncbi:phage tail tube protein [Lacrimispora defluvii]|uniref:Phage tail tube protein n=1 Tax=Lacrimispora defluvii TaxID=2719233 RepID=A0ABX1VPH7_9FIRM|nr:phage tail tube protein [Lacrimispora defluvii]NNJ30343.1 phage tail tube protein [Lacrimispora defluvii]